MNLPSLLLLQKLSLIHSLRSAVTWQPSCLQMACALWTFAHFCSISKHTCKSTTPSIVKAASWLQVNSPPCSHCSCQDMQAAGAASPTAEEARAGAGRVELHTCKACHQTTRSALKSAQDICIGLHSTYRDLHCLNCFDTVAPSYSTSCKPQLELADSSTSVSV